MPTRQTTFEPGEYFHVYNRGARKHQVFAEDRDWIRFLFLILYLKSSYTPQNIARQVSHFSKHGKFAVEEGDLEQSSKLVELIAFALMPNHFHLLIKELEDGGVSRYLQRVLNAYTKYSNAKNQETGYLFQGPFQAVHIKDNNQLLYASAYVHRNPREIRGWQYRDQLYPWSSFQDYTQKNRWGNLISQNIILEQFEDGADYHTWVKGSAAKSEYDINEFQL